MKRNKYNVFCAWILLICFAAGQYMVYVHQHNILQKNISSVSVSKNHPKPALVLQEKCYMCDAMHYNAMIINHNAYYFPVVVQDHIYKTGDYDFISIALVLSAGRAPPVV